MRHQTLGVARAQIVRKCEAAPTPPRNDRADGTDLSDAVRPVGCSGLLGLALP
jgi:hypothetical protein